MVFNKPVIISGLVVWSDTGDIKHIEVDGIELEDLET
jgi:hypothetical protein